jgi:anti-sigma B factor antagonist
MSLATDTALGLGVSCRSERGFVIAALSGELDITAAPVLREKLLGLLHDASNLVIDLSAVSYADASGMAVLVGTSRRAGLLGGMLRLAAPTSAVTEALRLTGLHRRLDIFPTVQAALTGLGRGQRQMHGAAHAPRRAATAGAVRPRGQARQLRHDGEQDDDGELRQAIGAVLMHADAWRDADPQRQFTPALHALARAYAGTSYQALSQAAHSLVCVLASQPLTHSPAVAATASRLRRLLSPALG